ncbi:hypothetical protein K7432_001752 [Basidiobolus ranarum]|uniref:Uncharacterized protein n=1 Tax=Basidiobolus ranarum TaxID=34480 RepID=A0ABR2X2J2_9FUNG
MRSLYLQLALISLAAALPVDQVVFSLKKNNGVISDTLSSTGDVKNIQISWDGKDINTPKLKQQNLERKMTMYPLDQNLPINQGKMNAEGSELKMQETGCDGMDSEYNDPLVAIPLDMIKGQSQDYPISEDPFGLGNDGIFTQLIPQPFMDNTIQSGMSDLLQPSIFASPFSQIQNLISGTNFIPGFPTGILQDMMSNLPFGNGMIELGSPMDGINMSPELGVEMSEMLVPDGFPLPDLTSGLSMMEILVT